MRPNCSIYSRKKTGARAELNIFESRFFTKPREEEKPAAVGRDGIGNAEGFG